MAECQYKVCSLCKGVNQSAEYKLKASNFYGLRVELIKGRANIPITAPAPPIPDEGNKYMAAVVCNDCVASNPDVAALIALIEKVKENDAAILADINK